MGVISFQQHGMAVNDSLFLSLSHTDIAAFEFFFFLVLLPPNIPFFFGFICFSIVCQVFHCCFCTIFAVRYDCVYNKGTEAFALKSNEFIGLCWWYEMVEQLRMEVRTYEDDNRDMLIWYISSG